MNYYDDELQHFGVKGMKWGVRRNRSKVGSSNRKKTKSKFKMTDKQKKIAKGVAITALAAGTAYAGYKGAKYLDKKVTAGVRRMYDNEAIGYAKTANKYRTNAKANPKMADLYKYMEQQNRQRANLATVMADGPISNRQKVDYVKSAARNIRRARK